MCIRTLVTHTRPRLSGDEPNNKNLNAHARIITSVIFLFVNYPNLKMRTERQNIENV